MEVQKHSVHTLVFRSLKRTHDMFLSDQLKPPAKDEKAYKMLLATKLESEYGFIKDLVNKQEVNKKVLTLVPIDQNKESWKENHSDGIKGPSLPSSDQLKVANIQSKDSDTTLLMEDVPIDNWSTTRSLVSIGDQNMLIPKKAPIMPKPIWHPPWKLYRVISGHGGWVRCVDVEPGNEWFVTGSADRIIKIWDLSSGLLKLSLTGHISTVRGVVVGKNQPYLFSCGEDKQVKCWDLEYNKVIRHYHGHLSAVYSVDLHPTIDLLVSCGRDGTARVWDMRTKAQIHCLAGHTNTVSQVRCQAMDPQVITCSHDSTVRLWDIVAGRSLSTLTNHKKSVRSVVIHPTLNMMASGSPDNIKQWKLPEGNFLQNMTGHNAIINSLAVSSQNILVSGGDSGSIHFWDWRSGYNFQRLQTAVQPGSIDSEAGIFAMTFDKSESRLITCEADKTIKIYKEDETATEETHPLNWKAEIIKKKY